MKSDRVPSAAEILNIDHGWPVAVVSCSAGRISVRIPNVSVTTSVVTRCSTTAGRGHRDEEPVVTVDQGELHDEELGQVDLVGVELAEVGDAVLERPPAAVGHAAERDVQRQEVEAGVGGCLRRRAESVAGAEAERVPVQVPPAEAVRLEHHGPAGLRGRGLDRERVAEVLTLPGPVAGSLNALSRNVTKSPMTAATAGSLACGGSGGSGMPPAAAVTAARYSASPSVTRPAASARARSPAAPARAGAGSVAATRKAARKAAMTAGGSLIAPAVPAAAMRRSKYRPDWIEPRNLNWAGPRSTCASSGRVVSNGTAAVPGGPGR